MSEDLVLRTTDIDPNWVERIEGINTAGFALAYMNPEPEALSEIIFNLEFIIKQLTGQ